MIPRLIFKKYSGLLTILLGLYILYSLHFPRTELTNPGTGPSIITTRFHHQPDWQRVNGSWCHFIVYSAYAVVDRHPEDEEEVVIIGVTKTNTNESVNCRFYLNENSDDGNWDSTTEPTLDYLDYQQVPGTIETTMEHRFRFYAAVFIKCPLPPWKPTHVSVVLSTETEATNKLGIQYKSEPIWEPEPHQYNFTFSMCVNPAYDYNEVFHFIEWIEFYKLMGVEQFTLFNVSFGPDTSCILNDLVEGSDPSIKMNVYQYHNVPIVKKAMIKGRCSKCALSAAANDCLYRHRGRLSKYMVFVDFDEFIMPREHIAQNYSELIDYLDSQNPDMNLSHYSFRNGFFFLSRPDDPTLQQRCSELKNEPFKYDVCQQSYLMSKDIRNEYNPFPKRTKYIIKPEGVTEASTHYALQFEPGYETLNVSETIAFSRHYRKYTFHKSQDEPTETDRVIQRFGLKLVENIAKSLKYFTEKCKFKFENVTGNDQQRQNFTNVMTENDHLVT